MGILLTVLIVIAAAELAVLLIAYICYRMAFYAPNRVSEPGEDLDTPQGEIYAPFRAQMEDWIRLARATPHEVMTITSFDGLTLRGNYYEYAPGAPIELMFHGYRGTAERDLSGGVQRCFELGRSALIVNQRGSVGSEGHVISFASTNTKTVSAG